MRKLFNNIPKSTRDSIVIFIENTILHTDKRNWAPLVADFAKQYHSDEIKDFIDFYFNLRMEQLKDESSND